MIIKYIKIRVKLCYLYLYATRLWLDNTNCHSKPRPCPMIFETSKCVHIHLKAATKAAALDL